MAIDGPRGSRSGVRLTNAQASQLTLHRRLAPVLDGPTDLKFSLGGWIGDRVHVNEANWLVPTPASNPGMVEMFAHRNDLKVVNGPFAKLPPNDWRNPDPLPWAGEFAGKYLIAAVQSLRMTDNPLLHRTVTDFVQALIGTQGDDGSLGMPLAWDLWGQYHVMLGLLRWYQYSGDARAFTACTRAADLACARYLGRASAIAADNPADDEKNQAVAHVLALLYQQSGQSAHLELVHQIESEWGQDHCFNPGHLGAIHCGDFVGNALAGQDFFKGTRPRWESLHDVQAMAELYFITGEARYRRAVEQIWRSIRELDRHATGGFSSDEAARGNPYDPRYIETCGTVAWMALTIDMLRMTADATAADELELSLFNAVLGAQSPDGRHWTYHTPMGGVPIVGVPPPAAFVGYRLPAHFDLDWQQRDRYPQLSCCAANGPRGLGCLSEWAIMRGGDAIAVNFYGPSEATLAATDGTQVTLQQETRYPTHGMIQIGITPSSPALFAIHLRIPAWSPQTSVRVNGQEQPSTPGTYCELRRVWNPGDVITLTLDLSVRVVAGQRDATGRSVAYRGPLLLAYDERRGHVHPVDVPAVNLGALPSISTMTTDAALVATFPSAAGDIALCDFASAGQSSSGSLPQRPDPSVPWQFSRSDRSVIAQRIRLRPGGGIEGYLHPNEARWGFDGDDLTFYTTSGAPSTRFTMRAEQNGRQVLNGVSLLDPRVRHILAEIGASVGDKTWQFWRTGPGGDTILRPKIRLLPDGGFDVRTHPNESRWGMEGDTLVFYAADGSASTRFSSILVQNGRVERRGQFLFEGWLTHVLSEVDVDLTSKIWRFWRRKPGVDDVVINDKVRLLSNHRLDGHRHPNESRWGMEGDTLVFYAVDGSVSTRFSTLQAAGGLMVYEGPFAGDRSITHRLEERAPGWRIGSPYVAWLPTP